MTVIECHDELAHRLETVFRFLGNHFLIDGGDGIGNVGPLILQRRDLGFAMLDEDLEDGTPRIGDFASEWTETIVDYVKSVFTWVPSQVGMAFKVICILAFLTAGVQFGFTGWGLLLLTGSGWFAPRIIAGLLQFTIFTSLVLLYLSFIVLVAVLGVGVVLGGIYGLAVFFA